MDIINHRNLILASASPRRIEMFRNAGYDPVVMPASIIESVPFEMDPENTTMFLALKKASSVSETVKATAPAASDTIIVAADTVVVLDGQIIGKPKGRDDAFAILKSMKDRSHHVITGCCVIKDGESHCFYEDTEVYFKDYSDEELIDYINTPEPYDKAGGYAIQGSFGQYIDHIDGDFDNVVGLPFSRVLTYL